MEVWRGGRGGWRLETVVFRLSQQKALENWCFSCVAGVYDEFGGGEWLLSGARLQGQT